MVDNAPTEQVLVDEEIGDGPGLVAEDSERSGEAPTGETPTTEKSDPDPLSEEGEEDLEEELATAGQPPVTPAAPAAAAPEKKPAKPEPFKYTGDKRELVLEGTHYYAGDGLYIPDAQVPKLKQLLANAAVHNGSWQQEKRQFDRALKEAREGRNEKDVAADALMDLVFKDLGKLKTQEEVEEWAYNFLQKLPEHRIAIRERQLEHRQKQFDRQLEVSPEEREEQHSGIAGRELERTLQEIFQMPEMKVLDAADQQDVRARFGPHARSLLSEAPHDDPSGQYKQGDLIFDGARLLEQIRVTAGIKSRAINSANAARAAADANRKKLGTGAPAARVPGSATSSAPAKEGVVRDQRTGRFKNREEFEEWARSGAE